MEKMITQPDRLEEVRLSQTRIREPAGPEPDSSAQVPEKKKESESSESRQAKELLQRVNQLNAEIAHADVALKIRIDHETGKNLIKVVDRKTGEVLREIPPEEVVRLEARIEKMIGIFLDRSI